MNTTKSLILRNFGAMICAKKSLEGGGGNGKQRRRFADVRRIISAFAVIFAAAFFAIPANAQETTAKASVYIRTSGMANFPIGGNVNFDDSVAGVVQQMRTNRPDLTNEFASNFRLATPGHPVLHNRPAGQDAESFVNDIPFFDNNGVMATLTTGDILILRDPALALAAGALLTARIYDADNGGGVSLAMITLSGETKTPSELGANEFFLNTATWTTVAVLTDTDDIAGFAEPTCGPEGVATDRLTCNDPLPTPGDNNEPVTESSGAPKKDRRGDNFIGGIGFLVLFGVLYNFNPNPDALTFSPDFGYSVTESGYSANAGGRMDFATDNWRLYLTAGQTNRNGDFGDFRYKSGGEYRSDSGLWTTAFSESVQGDVANYDFALSADVQNGIWNLSPTYRFNSVLDWNANESDSRNSLNIESVLRMNRWLIRPTAGFNWRRMNEFGDSAKFSLSAEHRF